MTIQSSDEASLFGGGYYSGIIVDQSTVGSRLPTSILETPASVSVITADEPTTFLDIRHQVEVLDLLQDLNAARGTTIVMVLHDLNLAARYCDQLIAMSDGRLHASGPPASVLTEETVRHVFGIDSRIVEDPISGRPMMLPIGRHRVAATTGGPA